VDFYAGYVFEGGKRIVYSQDRERFCCECLVSGRAAKEKQIIFNNELLHKDTLLYSTPGVSHNFETNEDIWPLCCDDFCCYMGRGEYSCEFQCVECGKKITWEDFT